MGLQQLEYEKKQQREDQEHMKKMILLDLEIELKKKELSK